MYFLLCAAVDRSLDELQRIPLAAPAAALLQNALLQAEAIYIETSPHAAGTGFLFRPPGSL